MQLGSANYRCLSSFLLLACLSFCTNPNENKRTENQAEVIEFPSKKLNTKIEAELIEYDSLRTIQNYVLETTERIQLISEDLDQINQVFKSNKSGVNFAFQGVVFQLKKKILSLKIEINDLLKYQGISWEASRARLTNELDMLEDSVAELKTQSEK